MIKYLLLLIFPLASCTEKHNLDVPRSRAEKDRFSQGSILENTSYSLKFTLDQKEKSNEFQKLKEAVRSVTGAEILLSNEKEKVILTSYFYDETQKNRFTLHINYPNKEVVFNFSQEKFLKQKNKWVKVRIDHDKIKIIKDSILIQLKK